MVAYDLVRYRSGGDLAGERTHAGTRKAPSQLEFFSFRKGVVPASGQVFMCGPLSVLYMHERVVGYAKLVEQVRASRRRACRGRSSHRGIRTASGQTDPRLSGFTCVQACICVVFNQTKNGASGRVRRLMKSFARGRNSSSQVSIRFLVSGPVSSMF